MKQRYSETQSPTLRRSEDLHVIGQESDLLRFDWLDILARFAPILFVIVYGP
jgi:hypothetical protein